MNQDAVELALVRLDHDLVSKLERDQQLSHRLVVPANDQADIVPLLREMRGCKTVDHPEKLANEHTERLVVCQPALPGITSRIRHHAGEAVPAVTTEPCKTGTRIRMRMTQEPSAGRAGICPGRPNGGSHWADLGRPPSDEGHRGSGHALPARRFSTGRNP